MLEDLQDRGCREDIDDVDDDEGGQLFSPTSTFSNPFENSPPNSPSRRGTFFGSNGGGTPSSQSKIVHKGFLSKRGERGPSRSWKSRFFVLHADGVMSYFETDKMLSRKGGFDVKGGSILRDPDPVAKHLFGIQPAGSSRVYFLQCDGDTGLTKWLEMLQAAGATEKEGKLAMVTPKEKQRFFKFGRSGAKARRETAFAVPPSRASPRESPKAVLLSSKSVQSIGPSSAASEEPPGLPSSDSVRSPLINPFQEWPRRNSMHPTTPGFGRGGCPSCLERRRRGGGCKVRNQNAFPSERQARVAQGELPPPTIPNIGFV